MKKRVPIGDLAVGMFVEAHVDSKRDGNTIRHFLAPCEAIYGQNTSKRARLTKGKHKQVAHAGGLLLNSASHVAALRATGLEVVTIDTDKGTDVGPHASAFDVRESDGSMDASDYAALLLGSADAAQSTTEPSANDCFLDVVDEAPEATSESPQKENRRSRPAREGRLQFGPSGRAWMKVEIDESHQAVLRVLSFGGDETLGEKDVIQALREHYGLQAGLDRKLISHLSAQAASSPTRVLRGLFGIAEVEVVTEPEDDVDYTFLDGLRGDTGLDYGPLKTALGLETIEEVLAQDPLTRAVIPGEKLAVMKNSRGERSVLDIFGKRQSRNDPPLEAGDNVDIVGNSYVSRIYGYVCLLDGLSVISPLWVSPDEVEAHFVDFRQAGSPSVAVREWVEELLILAGINTGVRGEAFEELQAERCDRTARSVLVARGTPPVPGADAHIEFDFDPKLWPGAFLDDGSVDFRERNAYTRVEDGQLLGTIHAAKRGKPGQSIFGKTIDTRDGDRHTFNTNDKIRVDGSPRRLYSRVDGSVRVRGDDVAVHEVIEIRGDVDYNLGNIDAGKDVYITGSIKPGFSVKLVGDLLVGGTIEGGASINAGGDVAVARGIVGKDTRIVALGSVHAKFVQNSSVMARGDIVVGSYLLNANVRAGGRLIVRRSDDGRGGSIVGGQALATQLIDAWSVGSASTDRTTIGIVAPPDVEARSHKLKKAVDTCDQFIMRAFRTLGLKTIDAGQMKKLIERTPRQEREPIMKVLRQLKQVTATLVSSKQKMAELERESEETLRGGEIHVHGTAYVDVEVKLGSRTLRLDQDLKQPVFCVTGDDISVR